MPKYTNEEFNTWYVNEARARLAGQGFDVVRAEWKKGFRDQKAQLRYMAEAALELFAKTGDNAKLNNVLSDLMSDGRNVLRPAAFVKWVVAHQPIKYVDEKLVKDRESGKTAEEYAVLLVEALQMPYWDFAPDKEMQQFGGGDIIAALDGVLKRYTGKKFVPKDDATLNVLTQAMIKVAELRRIVPISALIAATPSSHLSTSRVEVETAVMPADDNKAAA